MLPDFPKIKDKFRKAINTYLQNLVKNDPVFSQIKVLPQFEGNKISSRTATGDLDVSQHQEMGGQMEIRRDEVIAKGVTAWVEKIHNVANEIKAQKAELLFSKLKESTDRTGNVVDAKGEPFSFEVFTRMIEKIQIDFDKDGKPFLPTIVVNPKLGEELKSILPEWESNPEYTKRLSEIFARKRKEWNDRESNRKLVD